MAYKSAKVIFEKASRGELEDYSSSPSLFSKFEFNKKAELVKPYLHYIDDKALIFSVNNFITCYNNHQELINLARRYNKTIINGVAAFDQIQKIWKNFPKSIVNDIYNIYYNNIEDLEFTDRTILNKSRYQFLDKASDPVIKVITNHNNIKSMIFTRGQIQYYLIMLALLEQESPEAFEEMMKQLKGEGSDSKEDTNNSDSSEESENQKEEEANNEAGKSDEKKSVKDLLEDLKKRFDGQQSGSQAIYDKIIENSKESSKKVEQLMSADQQQGLWGEISKGVTKAYEKTDSKFLERIQSELSKVKMNMNSVRDKIKKLLDNSISYFSAKDVTIYENILEASGLDGMEDWILMHPKLRKVFIHDINVKETKKLGKINMYIDVSGSMGVSAGIPGEDGKFISKELFSKAFTYQMKKSDILSQVYSFQKTVSREGETLYDILTIAGGGGTNLNKVVEHINNLGKNAIVLTDAEDLCNIYSPYAYFIGVAGCKFHRFDHHVLKQYNENNQIIVFDGKNISRVDNKGYIIEKKKGN